MANLNQIGFEHHPWRSAKQYKYTSTKEYHDSFPCAYRQWRADSHCNMIHGYSSDLNDFIMDHPQIKLWTHGHTHEDFDYMIGDGARANLFSVDMFLPSYALSAQSATNKMRFMAKSAQLPGSTIGTVPMFYFGREMKFAGNRSTWYGNI